MGLLFLQHLALATCARDSVHLSWNDCDGSRVSTICVIRALRRLRHQMEEGYRGVSENHWFMAKSCAATSHVPFLGYCYSIVLNEVKDDKNLCTTVLEIPTRGLRS